MESHSISTEDLSLDKVTEILNSKKAISLSDEAREKIISCRNYLDKKLAGSHELFYGINTGFGSLCNVKIADDQINRLQENLVVSHACGTGDEVPNEIVKIMLLLKIRGLSYGNSGVDLNTVWRLVDFYNHEIFPVIYEQGSLGASGDLAPLAHLALPLLGKGKVFYKNQYLSSEELNKIFSWKPVELKSKEGLGLLNGTQFMGAYGIYILSEIAKLKPVSELISALSLDAFDCRMEPFEPFIHKVRPHTGQTEAAKNILKLLSDSSIAKKNKAQVQDPYSFRCIPQVHGASYDIFDFAEKIFTTEINSVTDNPIIFPEEDRIISGGNFHGQPLAISLDMLALAIAELGSISERRTYLLLSGERDLPPYLISNPGVNSGLMITQYTAAALVSQNKQFCTPASADSIVSSNGQEDHVSMGANAATKCLRVLKNVQTIFAIELLCAAQALEFRRPMKSSNAIEKFMNAYREKVSFNTTDRILHDDVEQSVSFIKSYKQST
jgi:histidine ammonia-lyase